MLLQGCGEAIFICLFSGEDHISLGVLQSSDGSFDAGGDECFMVQENLQGDDQNYF